MIPRTQPAPAFNPWVGGRYRFGCAGALSAAVHAALGLLLLGIVVRSPDVAPPIRVSLYDPAPPPPASASGAEAVAVPSSALQLEQQHALPKTKPARVAVPRVR